MYNPNQFNKAIQNEAKTLLGIFKNSVSFTLAITTLTELSKTSPEYLYLIISTIILIGIITLIRQEVSDIRAREEVKLEQTNGVSILYGPIRCIGFLANILLNILTQFLSTLIARYILTFVPDPTDIYQVSYILLVILSLFWCGLYTIGVDWKQLP